MRRMPEKYWTSGKGGLISVFLISLVIVAAGIGIFFWSVGQNDKSFSLDISGADSAFIGAPFDIGLDLVNNDKVPAEDISVTITLPSGMAFADSAGLELKKDIGTINPLEIKKETVKVVITDGIGDKKSIKAYVEFRPTSLTRALSDSAEKEIGIKKPIEMSFDMPKVSSLGSEFHSKVSLKNVSDAEVKGELALSAPAGFESDFKPFGFKLAPGEDSSADITGSIVASDGGKIDLKFSLNGGIGGKNYVIDEQTKTVNTNKTALSVDVELKNGGGLGDKYEPSLGETLKYVITVTNGSDNPISDIKVSADMKGLMYDLERVPAVSADAGIASSTDTASGTGAASSSNDFSGLSWNSEDTPDLKELAPGGSAMIVFEVPVVRSFPLGGDANPSLDAEVRAEGISDSDSAFTAVAFAKNIVSGRAAIEAFAMFRDPSSRIANSGKLPLLTNTPTDFTVHWRPISYGGDLKQVKISAVLPAGSEITGKQKVIAGALSYDTATRTMLWSIDNIAASSGGLSKSSEAIFQIRVIPAKENIGNYIEIIGETNMTATDTQSEKDIGVSHPAVTTRLEGDSSVKEGQGMVQ